MKIYSKTHQIAPFKTNFSGKHAPEPPYQTLGYATRRKPLCACNSASHRKSWAPPWQILRTPHGLQLRNIFQEMRS